MRPLRITHLVLLLVLLSNPSAALAETDRLRFELEPLYSGDWQATLHLRRQMPVSSDSKGDLWLGVYLTLGSADWRFDGTGLFSRVEDASVLDGSSEMAAGLTIAAQLRSQKRFRFSLGPRVGVERVAWSYHPGGVSLERTVTTGESLLLTGGVYGAMRGGLRRGMTLGIVAGFDTSLESFDMPSERGTIWRAGLVLGWEF